MTTAAEFEKQYLLTWTESDPVARLSIIDQIWCKNGRIVISSLGSNIQGIDEIAAHITHVHEESIIKKGLHFIYDQHAEAGGALLLRWSILTSSGSTASRGVDMIFRNQDGRVETVYMFVGIE